MQIYWPILLVVGSNIIYHICAKSAPEGLNPLASLLATYSVGSVFAVILYYATAENADIVRELGQINWAPMLLGLAIVGLEAGNIYMYKAGWNVNTGYIVQSAILAIALLGVGYLLYDESITFNKAFGILICMLGLWFINK